MTYEEAFAAAKKYQPLYGTTYFIYYLNGEYFPVGLSPALFGTAIGAILIGEVRKKCIDI